MKRYLDGSGKTSDSFAMLSEYLNEKEAIKLPKITPDTIIVGPDMEAPDNIVRGHISSVELNDNGLYFDVRSINNPDIIVAVWCHECRIETS